MNIKKLSTAIIVALAAVCVRAATWTDPATGYTWTYTVRGDTATIYGGPYQAAISPTPTGTLTIPTALEGKQVTSIGDYAFYDCSGLASVTIPDSVTSIGDYAFYGCSGLASVTIPDSVTSIGDYTFDGCSGLASVTIPDSVTSIGDYTFDGCSGLASVTIPDSVTSIGDCAFWGCSGLASVTIPNSVTNIGHYAFRYCRGLMSVTIGSGVTSIGDYAFAFCTNWSETVINVSDIAAWCANTVNRSFSGKRRLLVGGEEVFDLQIPDGVTSIGDYAFDGCSGLARVTIPDSVTSIGDCAFRGCSGLARVTIPDSVTSIGDYAFYGCSGLASVTIPDSVTSIGDYTFDGCSGLASVTIPDSVTSIGDYTFDGCSGLASVTIPNSVTSIGDYAFSNCLLVFSGEPPSWAAQFSDSCFYAYPLEYEAQWKSIVKSSGVIVKIISSNIRENNPTILDTRFMVLKSGPIGMSQTVKIRALAFEDGERSFAKVVRPETFVDGTAPANWDAVEANVEHTLSWKVSSDWATRLAKVKFEVLASDGDLLPLELRTIPASDEYGKMKISWNEITVSQVFNALLWQYADRDPGLTLAGGLLKGNGLNLVNGAELAHQSYYVCWDYRENAVRYIYSKMGYQLLTGAPLSYAKRETRLELSLMLSPFSVGLNAYKIVEE